MAVTTGAVDRRVDWNKYTPNLLLQVHVHYYNTLFNVKLVANLKL